MRSLQRSSQPTRLRSSKKCKASPLRSKPATVVAAEANLFSFRLESRGFAPAFLFAALVAWFLCALPDHPGLFRRRLGPWFQHWKVLAKLLESLVIVVASPVVLLCDLECSWAS